MSGICGVIHLDGAPVERGLLHGMTRLMAFRGPDRQETWIEGPAGFGHALLRTTLDLEEARQPMTVDGECWITADARIDGQRELRQALEAFGRAVPVDCGDAALILNAWHAWGEKCLEHLVGDFAFAIWDRRRRRLFCARDRFGVKPFFYARAGQRVIFSNTLDCVRFHPAITGALDDLAISDCLLFEMIQDPSATAFAEIRRLPPAAFLVATGSGVRTATYWSLPLDRDIRYRKEGDYVEHFRELMALSVRDRMRSNRVAVSMSGGLDSTAIAATAKDILTRQSRPFDLQAHTVVYDRLIPDEERRYAGVAARALSIPVHFHAADDYALYERFDEFGSNFPEPFHFPDGAIHFDVLRAASASARVVLTGYDGDALLHESPKPYFRVLRDDRRFVALLGGIARYAVSQRRFWPLGWRKTGSRRSNGPSAPAYPGWLDCGLERRLQLRERWEYVHAEILPSHEVRPYAHRALSYLMRASGFFDQYDAGVTRLPLECRHPFLDLRLVGFCLSLPPVPWCMNKHILRSAMQGRLPDNVRLRPKTPLSAWPGARMLTGSDPRLIDGVSTAVHFDRYVQRCKIPAAGSEASHEEAWMNLRPLTLNLWLQGSQFAGFTTRARQHEIA